MSAVEIAERRPGLGSWPWSLVLWGILAMALDIGLARLTYGAVLPALQKDLDLTFTEAGLLSAINLAAYLLGTLVAPRLGRVLGMGWLASGGHALFAIGTAMSGLAGGVAVLGIGRFLMGFGAGIGLVALFVIVFARTEPRSRPAVSTAVWSGIGVGVILTGATLPWTLAGSSTWRLAFLVPTVLAAAVAYRFRPSRLDRHPSIRPNPAPVPIDGSARRGPARWLALFGGYFMFGAGYIAYSTFASSRLAAGGAAVNAMASSWVLYGIAGVVGCLLGAVMLSTSAIRRHAFTAAMLSGATGAFLAGLDLPAASFLGSAFVGLGLASSPAAITAFVRERTSDDDYARVFSLATASLGVGQLIGPVAAGLLADRFGSAAVPNFAASVYLAGTLLAAADGVLWRRVGRG